MSEPKVRELPVEGEKENSSNEMEKIVEKLGLTDLFGYICPGMVLLGSLFLWFDANFDSPFWKQQVLVISAALIAAYALGLVLYSFNQSAQEHHIRRRSAQVQESWRVRLSSLVGFLYLFPPSKVTPSIVEVNLRIAEELSKLSGLAGLSTLTSPTDWLVLYRTMAADVHGDKAKVTIEEACAFHRRTMFCMGMALAMLVVSGEALARIALLYVCSCDLPTIKPAVLVALCALALGSSIVLRSVAIRMRELERYLVASLARI